MLCCGRPASRRQHVCMHQPHHNTQEMYLLHEQTAPASPCGVRGCSGTWRCRRPEAAAGHAGAAGPVRRGGEGQGPVRVEPLHAAVAATVAVSAGASAGGAAGAAGRRGKQGNATAIRVRARFHHFTSIKVSSMWLNTQPMRCCMQVARTGIKVGICQKGRQPGSGAARSDEQRYVCAPQNLFNS